MSFTWTAHRFSGGALALDVANSVVMRFDAERRIDRFDDPAAIDTFAEAANLYGAERNRFARSSRQNQSAEMHSSDCARRRTAISAPW